MGRTAYAVIGANFGDEGKGLATDALAAELTSRGLAPLVVRSNGGAQAGHTVETQGRRHVFHHVGSGAFTGARTHLSRFFVAHPMLFLRELEELRPLLPAPPELTIDPGAQVTTPWDVFLNQAAEAARGAGRHGSCGVGFGETLKRADGGFGLTVSDLTRPDLRDRLSWIRDGWALRRLEELGVQDRPDVTGNLGLLWSDAVLDRFFADVRDFLGAVSSRSDAEIGSETLLFEGAQGLMLDQDLGVMPHLTPSNTGIRNMIAIAETAGIDEIRPLYMTRAYMTRHGAGPLKHETETLPWAEVVDPTNRPNAWQGALRLAPLDLDETTRFIKADLSFAEASPVRVVPVIGMTCLDQVSGRAEAVLDGARRGISTPELPELFAEMSGAPVGLLSYGPDRGAVRLGNASAGAHLSSCAGPV
jgi:adenylosuccinate synthase